MRKTKRHRVRETNRDGEKNRRWFSLRLYSSRSLHPHAYIIFDFWVLINVPRACVCTFRVRTRVLVGSGWLAGMVPNRGLSSVNITPTVVCYSRRTLIWNSTRHGSACDRYWIRLRTGKRERLPSGRLGSGRLLKTNWTECFGQRPCARAAR